MIGMSMRDDRSGNSPPRIDVEVTFLAVKPGGSFLKEQFCHRDFAKKFIETITVLSETDSQRAHRRKRQSEATIQGPSSRRQLEIVTPMARICEFSGPQIDITTGKSTIEA